MVQVSEKVLGLAKKWLVDSSAKWRDGVTFGVSWTLDGKMLAGGASATFCHSWVATAYSGALAPVRDLSEKDRLLGYARPYKAEAANFLTMSCHSKGRSKGICSEEAHEAIILWLASDECPLSKYILNRDDKESLLNGGVIILCGPDGANWTETLWLCKVLRYGVESGQALDTWLALTKGGVNPFFALYVCTFVRTVKGATFTYTGAVAHNAVFNEVDDKYLQALVKGVPDRRATCTQALFTGPIKNLKNWEIHEKKIGQLCKPIPKPDGWGKTVAGAGADQSDFISRVLAWQKKLEKGDSLLDKLRPGKKTIFLEADL